MALPGRKVPPLLPLILAFSVDYISDTYIMTYLYNMGRIYRQMTVNQACLRPSLLFRASHAVSVGNRRRCEGSPAWFYFRYMDMDIQGEKVIP